MRLIHAFQLYFSGLKAHNEIYNNRNRWLKEPYSLQLLTTPYNSFGEEQSPFGYLHYREAKERKDALNRVFSVQAIEQTQLWSVRDKVC